jgi:hypothetical protein
MDDITLYDLIDIVNASTNVNVSIILSALRLLLLLL